jgi:ribonuclease P protein component
VKRKYSLKGNALFKEILEKGRRYSGTGLRIVVLSNNKIGKKREIANPTPVEVKIGIALRRKHGGSVVRNRSKRIIRSICRELIPAMKGGYYVIVQPDDSFKGHDYRMLRMNAEMLFRKAGIIKG